MVFFSNSQGTITQVVSSQVYKNSNSASEIVLVAPFAENVFVSVGFILPNGVITTRFSMVLNSAENIPGTDDENLHAWRIQLPGVLTETSGTVTAQFFVMNGSQVISTSSATFDVQKGVGVIEHEGEPATAFDELANRVLVAEGNIDDITEEISDLESVTENDLVASLEMDSADGTAENTKIIEYETYNAEGRPVGDGSLKSFVPMVSTGNIVNKAVTKEKLSDSLRNEIDEKANPDGYYANMSVGAAEQLIPSVVVIEKTPYLYRPSGGRADIGNLMNDKLVGGTVNWNQLCTGAVADPVVGRWTLNGITCERITGGIKLTGTSTNTATAYIDAIYPQVPLQVGHKYLFSSNQSALNIYCVPLGITSSFAKHEFIGLASGSLSQFYIIVPTNTTLSGVEIKVNVFDLTLMFGPSIADYIYSLEQSTAGAGIAWFRNMFPKPYYEYNPGEMISVKTSAHKTVGFNAYNHATGKARLIGGNEYQITGTYTGLSYSTGETISPDTSGKFTPTESGVLTVTGGNASNTCVHLVWSGYRDGEYEEYAEHIYPLDGSLNLRGIPKLDSANKLYYDGDTYEHTGKVTRKYTVVDLGTLSWFKDGVAGAGGQMAFKAYLAGAKGVLSTQKANAICEKYILTTCYDLLGSGTGFGIQFAAREPENHVELVIVDNNYSSASAEDFKNAMSGVHLVYELETPTTETADQFTDPQIVYDFGTEEYVVDETNDVNIPVGHETLYMANLRDKLQNLPDSVGPDGLYLIQLNGNKQSLSKFVPSVPSEVQYTTQAPTADNPKQNTLAIVVLTAEPQTKYNGYLYIITEA